LGRGGMYAVGETQKSQPGAAVVRRLYRGNPRLSSPLGSAPYKIPRSRAGGVRIMHSSQKGADLDTIDVDELVGLARLCREKQIGRRGMRWG
jgi:hypothetical protein